jgi:hypothetical protein
MRGSVPVQTRVPMLSITSWALSQFPTLTATGNAINE